MPCLENRPQAVFVHPAGSCLPGLRELPAVKTSIDVVNNVQMKKNGFRLYTGYLLGKNRRIYREMAWRYHTHPWVIYRLIHGTSIRSEKELYIFRRLKEGDPDCKTGQGR